jgi:hypothetical protein
MVEPDYLLIWINRDAPAPVSDGVNAPPTKLEFS